MAARRFVAVVLTPKGYIDYCWWDGTIRPVSARNMPVQEYAPTMPKPPPTSVPVLTTDAEAEAFLAQDLSALDPTQFKPTRFTPPPKPPQPPRRRP